MWAGALLFSEVAIPVGTVGVSELLYGLAHGDWNYSMLLPLLSLLTVLIYWVRCGTGDGGSEAAREPF
jgi:hypothetical protein